MTDRYIEKDNIQFNSICPSARIDREGKWT